MSEKICHICFSDDIYYGDSEEEVLVCDICEEYYCHDCSYTFTIHYQHQGSRCYHCSGQSRLKPLDKRECIINYFLKQ